MKLSSSSSKPLSSPGRAEKFPPPLMRFLRTSTSSKSHRARSRSSPMFIVCKRTAIEGASHATAAKIPEPSSPKVTCMGQVRVKRSKPKPAKRTRNKPPKKASTFACRCQWLTPTPRALFSRAKLSRPILGKWASFFQLSFRRKVETRENHIAVDNNNNNNNNDNNIEPSFSEKDDSEGFAAEAAEPPPPPPVNALILTRCRSAPYRSSSLARRFWESPLKSDEEEKQSVDVENRETEKEEEKEEEEEEEKEREELGLGLGLGFAVLTRCKSEPARIGEKLGVRPEFGVDDYRGRRRFGFVNSRSTVVL